MGGANTYTGGTTINGGVLLGDSSSITGNYTNNALVVFDQTGAGTYGGTMGGTGTLAQVGPGTLTLSGTNSYTGGTFISGGGAVSISRDTNLGGAAGGVSLGDPFSAGTLTFANGASAFNSSRAFSLGTGNGIFNTTGTGLVTLSGPLPAPAVC